MKPDPYALLGLDRRASADDITRAYRRAARRTHPDARPGHAAAADTFTAVTEAYETLRDPVRRAAYDRAHPRVAQPVRPSTSNVNLRARRRRGVIVDGYVRIRWFRS